ncbi:MAG: hypothetical protein JWO15_3519 [Sphingomonadales bacterium]|nr:hypothetical protein [Sphingomonadales bacterium]
MNIDIATTRTVAKFVVGRSVSVVVASALANLVPTTTKTQKVQVVIGATVVGAMVSDAACDYADKQMDAIAKAVTEFKNRKNDK